MRRLAFMILLGLAVTLPAQAGLVKVEFSGVVLNNVASPPVVFNKDIVKPGDPVRVSFLVDSNNFSDSLVVPSRGYIIDNSSYALTFDTATGPVAVPLITLYPGNAYFGIWDASGTGRDKFFVSNSVVNEFDGVFLAGPGARFGPFFQMETILNYTAGTLSSRDIYDALGTHGFDGMISFEYFVFDGSLDFPVVECTFQQLTITRVPVEVPVDLKPGGCPNPINLKSHGVQPVAILGTPTLDVTNIDPASIRLNGVAPLRSSLEDVGTPFSPFTGKADCEADCTAAGPDGFLDLSLKFDTQAIAATLGNPADGSCATLHLTGNFVQSFDQGGPIVGEDVARIQK